MKKNIDALRNDIVEVNSSLFEILNKRKKIVSDIQKLKNGPSWKPKVELKVFSDALKNQDLTLKELLIFSNIVEFQVLKDCYPQWSCRVHIETESIDHRKLEQQINPILLYVFDKKLYNATKLKPNFKKIIEESI